MSNKGKLYVKTPQGELEFVKDCEQREYVELAIHSPEQYVFIGNSEPGPTIQDLNNFANRSMQNINNANATNNPISPKSKWSMLETWYWAAGIIATIIMIIYFIIYLMK